MNRSETRREAVLRLLSITTFLVIFQAYLVAPLIPALAKEFNASVDFLGLIVPAYMLPYGICALFYGPFSDRIGRKAVILSLLAMMVLTIGGTATARTAWEMIAWRLACGITSGGVVPISLAPLGDLFPYQQRGRPIGWIFAAVAGGMAFGSTCGALLNPILGWRAEFVWLAAFSAVVLFSAICLHGHFQAAIVPHPLSARKVLEGYLSLLSDARGAKVYTYILFNGMFHSGIFSWLGLYFEQRYQLGDAGIGLALLSYGIPGMLFGPLLGQIADRIGRKRIIPFGILIAAVAGVAFIPETPLVLTAMLTGILSLGYDMSHPLLAGISTSLNPARRGLAMGMNAFAVFTGYGLGPLLFELLLKRGFNQALIIFSVAQFVLGALAIPFLRDEDSSMEAADLSG